MKTFAQIVLAGTCLLLVSACSTTSVNLKYASDSTRVPIASSKGVSVKPFEDARGEKDARWFGAIRGGFGNPIKVLNADKPIGDVVSDAFTEGLKARNALAGGADAGYELRGIVKRFDCDQFARREATIELDLNVKRLSDGTLVFHGTKKSNIVSGSALNLAAGIFGSIEELRLVAEQALREVVDKTLDDPEFLQAVR